MKNGRYCSPNTDLTKSTWNSPLTNNRPGNKMEGRRQDLTVGHGSRDRNLRIGGRCEEINQREGDEEHQQCDRQ